jgi:hypothetical protein
MIKHLLEKYLRISLVKYNSEINISPVYRKLKKNLKNDQEQHGVYKHKLIRNFCQVIEIDNQF